MELVSFVHTGTATCTSTALLHLPSFSYVVMFLIMAFNGAFVVLVVI